MVKQILVATDNSEISQRAVAYAVDLAAALQSALTAIHVIDLPFVAERQSVPGSASPTHLTEPIEDYLRQAAEGLMNDLAASCRKHGIQFKSLIKMGHPVEKIIETAHSINADMIILGSHGRGALGATLLGSVALGIIHQNIHIAVLIVK